MWSGAIALSAVSDRLATAGEAPWRREIAASGLERGQQAQGAGVDAALHFPDEIPRALSTVFIDAQERRRPRRATGALRVC